MVKKSFFVERTEAQIKRLRKIETGSISETREALDKIQPDEYVQNMNNMIRGFGSVSFNKYGPITRMRFFRSVVS